jgi:integrase
MSLMHSVTPCPFPEFTRRIIALYGSGRHAKKTRLRMQQVLRELAELGVASTDQLTTEMMARYVRSKGPTANPNTVNGLLGTISAACSWAVEERWLDRGPCFRRVRLRALPPTMNTPPALDAVARLLGRLEASRGRWVDRRLGALAWTVALTGVRLNEAVHAQVVDLELVGPTPRLAIDPRRRRLKTVASARTVPVPIALAEVLARWIPETGSPWIFPGVKRRGPWDGGTGDDKSLEQLKAAAAGVGIERITWHSLRHAYGTAALEQWDVPLWVLQRVMGHTDIRTTQRYLHLDGSPKIAAACRGIRYRAG